MPRRRRLDLPGIPQHIAQRGNNRGVCYFCDDDRHAYLQRLAHHAKRLAVDVHAYVLMSNHVHLLATPHGGISTLMQDLGRDYVRIVNTAHRRSGTLWKGRFHACLIDSERHFLTCMRNIELNPVRAGMVHDPLEYVWSSHAANAFGQGGQWLTPHDVYCALGPSTQSRCSAYRFLFGSALDAEDEAALRMHTRQRAAWGGEQFQREIAAALGRSVAANAPGRPKRLPLNGI